MPEPIQTLTTIDAVRSNFMLQPRQKFIFEYIGIFGDEGTASALIQPATWTSTLVPGAMPATGAIFSMASVFMLAAQKEKLASTSAWPTMNPMRFSPTGGRLLKPAPPKTAKRQSRSRACNPKSPALPPSWAM